ncbi:MAG: hypothetical protein M0P57_09250 [Syntrophales bacterium]|jgi:formate C-acetyltransferase|nr:hypothetical protein [Syntrophales bacterium]MDY0044577.1 pyruvate formate lyase family protein [Syntrophales bacterium]
MNGVHETYGQQPEAVPKMPGSYPGEWRADRLREGHLKLGYNSASINRVRIETRVMKETEGEPMVMRRAKVFAALARETPTVILPYELIVGHSGIRPLCLDIIPDDIPILMAGKRLAPVRDTLEYSLKDFDPADQKELIEEIMPYWRGDGDWARTQLGSNMKALPDYLRKLLLVDDSVMPPKRSMIYACFLKGTHYGHNSASYEKVLDKGFLGIRKEAEEKLASLSAEQNKEREFLESVILSLDAAMKVGSRYAAEARRQAESEEDEERSAELVKIADVCERVPTLPARNLHEALQSIYLAQVLLNWESPRIMSQSPGRIDQYLYKYYRSDIDSGRLSQEEAQELFDCYFVKLNHVNSGSHISVGGYRPDGRDGTTEISYMLIESMKRTRLVEPFFSILVHPRTPEGLLLKAAELSSLGSGHPVYLNADVLTTMMLARGTIGGPCITLQQARKATPVGCYEPVVTGQDSGYMPNGFFNLAAILELVLTNGYSRFYKKKIGLETGDPCTFATFEEFREAYLKQLAYMAKNFSDAGNIFERVFAEVLPTPFESSLIDGCIEKAKTREDGGALFNFKLFVGAGSTDAGDSLTAIRKLVYEDKIISMKELCEALENNFEGSERLQKLLQDAPKFGNNDDYADEQVAWVSHVCAREVAKQPNTRGGFSLLQGGPLQYYVFGGWVVGALPSGRSAWQPLSDAWSPSAGCDKNGPTAVLGSMGKIDNAELSAGVTLNIRFDPGFFKQREGMRRFTQFIRAFNDEGIFHVQFNMVNGNTLREAQKNPENYRDLVVKVAGYSAYYTRLPKPLQDGIIARTEHRL